MFIIKNIYYLYIESIKDFDVNKVKNNKKINVIFRNIKNYKLSEIINYRLKCKNKKIRFYISNDLKMAKKCKADGLYISAFNKKKYFSNIHKIGSAHNLKEINEKILQGCKNIIFSRLFKTSYKTKRGFLGVIKFNLTKLNLKKNLYPLGGITNENLLKLNMVNSNGFALLSSVKKKPAITNRLF